MKYIKLDHTGLDVSRMCLVCMTYGVSAPIMKQTYVRHAVAGF